MEALATLTDKNGTKILVEEINDKVAKPSSSDRELIKAVSEKTNIEEEWGEHMQVAEFADGLTGQQLMERHLLTSSLNIDGIWAGFTDPGKVNTVLPKTATAKIDVRLVPDLKKADVAPAIRQHLDSHGFDAVDVRVLSGYEMSRTSIDAQIVQALLRTYKDWGIRKLDDCMDTLERCQTRHRDFLQEPQFQFKSRTMSGATGTLVNEEYQAAVTPSPSTSSG